MALTYRTVLSMPRRPGGLQSYCFTLPFMRHSAAGELVAPGITSVLCFFAYTARDHLQFNRARSGPLVRLHTGTREPPSPQRFSCSFPKGSVCLLRLRLDYLEQ
jgi:hypothetical protein